MVKSKPLKVGDIIIDSENNPTYRGRKFTITGFVLNPCPNANVACIDDDNCVGYSLELDKDKLSGDGYCGTGWKVIGSVNQTQSKTNLRLPSGRD
jgi:hypothetical protein